MKTLKKTTKNIVISSLLISPFITAIPLSATIQATAVTQSEARYKTTAKVKLYSQTGTTASSKLIKIVPKNTVLALYSTKKVNGQYYVKVTDGKKTGYMLKKYTKKISIGPYKSIAASKTTIYSNKTKTTLCSTHCKNLNSKSIRSIAKGTVLKVIGSQSFDGITYAKVAYKDKIGWIAMKDMYKDSVSSKNINYSKIENDNFFISMNAITFKASYLSSASTIGTVPKNTYIRVKQYRTVNGKKKYLVEGGGYGGATKETWISSSDFSQLQNIHLNKYTLADNSKAPYELTKDTKPTHSPLVTNADDKIKTLKLGDRVGVGETVTYKGISYTYVYLYDVRYQEGSNDYAPQYSYGFIKTSLLKQVDDQMGRVIVDSPRHDNLIRYANEPSFQVYTKPSPTSEALVNKLYEHRIPLQIHDETALDKHGVSFTKINTLAGDIAWIQTSKLLTAQTEVMNLQSTSFLTTDFERRITIEGERIIHVPLQLTADGELLIDNAEISSKTGIRYADHTLQSIQDAYTAIGSAQPITLTQLFDRYGKSLNYIIDIPLANYANLNDASNTLSQALNVIQAKNNANYIYIKSNSSTILTTASQSTLDLETMYEPTDTTPLDFAQIAQFSDIVYLPDDYFSETTVALATEANLKIAVNSYEDYLQSSTTPVLVETNRVANIVKYLNLTP